MCGGFLNSPVYMLAFECPNPLMSGFQKSTKGKKRKQKRHRGCSSKYCGVETVAASACPSAIKKPDVWPRTSLPILAPASCTRNEDTAVCRGLEDGQPKGMDGNESQLTSHAFPWKLQAFRLQSSTTAPSHSFCQYNCCPGRWVLEPPTAASSLTSLSCHEFLNVVFSLLFLKVILILISSVKVQNGRLISKWEDFCFLSFCC